MKTKYLLMILLLLFVTNSCKLKNEIEILVSKDVMIPMRDGVELATDITRTDDNKRYPVILMRTPYGKDNEGEEMGEFITDMGFALVIQDCRGTSKSDGEWIPGVNERTDGIDIRNWIVEQPWSNGKIGTYGESYLGFTQFASANESNKSLKAMVAGIPVLDWYNTAYEGGALNLLTLMGWGADMADPKLGEGALMEGRERDFKSLPLIDWDKINIGLEISWMRDWIKNPIKNDYWKNILSIKEHNEKLNIPLIITSGWHDVFSIQALDYVTDAIKRGKKDQHLIMGPGGHGFSKLPGGLEQKDEYFEEIDMLEFEWFNYWLRDGTEKPEIAPIKLFVMGKNYWRDEYDWPIKNTKYTRYYFSSRKSANSIIGNGFLSNTIPSENKEDRYIYDPNNPVPTMGGAILDEILGPLDQTEIENRKDVLVFTSSELNEDIEVIGNIKVVIYASTDVKNTDWTAKLLDVYPDGKPYNLCDGIIRASYSSDPLNPQNIEPGKIYKYEIDLWATANVFKKGHKIRVEISSSNFPRFDRNPNTGNEFGMDAELKTANQTVYHGNVYPSHIVLPVIPN